MVSAAFVGITVLILAVASVAFFAWALFNEKILHSAAEYPQINPYCFRLLCQDPKEMVSNPTRQGDPQQAAFQTAEYCIVNAPPAGFRSEIGNCTFQNDPNQVNAFREFIKFYDTQYTPNCAYTWKGINVTTANGVPPNENPNTNGLNGANDDLLVNTVLCAQLLQTEGVDLSAVQQNLASLKVKCGVSCS